MDDRPSKRYDPKPGVAAKAPTLAHVRGLVEENRRRLRPDRATREARWPVRSVGIVGAGTMGAEIAAAHLKYGLPVVIADADPRALDTAGERIAAELARDMPHDEARALVRRLVELTGDVEAAARCDLVLESIAERLAPKQQLLARLERKRRPEAILASNTSTIPIGRLGGSLADPSRLCGMHFCHPVRNRPLVEIVRGPATGEQTLAAAVAHAESIGKMPLVVEDGPGFVVNRLLLPYLNEALELLLEGATIEAVERTATGFGMPCGPLSLLDEIGLDTAIQAGWVLWEAFPERIAAPPLLVALVKAGRLGCKSGVGVFSYRDGVAAVDRTTREAIACWARPPETHTPDSITARMLLPMVLEATRVLEEGRVCRPGEVDLAALFGLGFPAIRGGPLWWADMLGAGRIAEMLRPLERFGPRWRPTATLAELARSGGRFFPEPVG